MGFIFYFNCDLTSAALAAAGSYIVASQGFPVLIIAVVIISLIGSLMLWGIKPYMKKAPRKLF
jgi:hypothetical protein